MTGGGFGRAAAVALVAVALAGGVTAARRAYVVTMVDGTSMRPALEPADLLLVQRQAPGVAVGDVVVFPRPGWQGGVAHRVVAILSGGRLTTRGDANPVADREPVPAGALVGRVVAYVPTGTLASRVATALRRWYTHEPIEQQATTETRSAP